MKSVKYELEWSTRTKIFITVFAVALATAMVFLSYGVVYPIDQSKAQAKTEAVSTDRVFKVDGHEYICHNNADFNYTTRTCYFDNLVTRH